MDDTAVRFHMYLLTEKRAARNTVQAYSADLQQYVRFLDEKKISLPDATDTHIKEFMHSLKNAGITAKSIARKVSSLKIFYSWATGTLQWPDYARKIVIPKVERTLPHVIDESAIEQLLQQLDVDTTPIGKRNKVFVYLLYSTGMRISELTELTINALRLDEGLIQAQGKGGKQRIIPLPEPIISLLNSYLQTIHLHFVTRHQPTDYLFPVAYGKKIKPLSRQAGWAIIKSFGKSIDLAHVSPHVLRHSLATHLLKNGVDLRSLQMLLGHENISTVQIYTHVEISHLRLIYDKRHPRSK